MKVLDQTGMWQPDENTATVLVKLTEASLRRKFPGGQRRAMVLHQLRRAEEV